MPTPDSPPPSPTPSGGDEVAALRSLLHSLIEVIHRGLHALDPHPTPTPSEPAPAPTPAPSEPAPTPTPTPSEPTPSPTPAPSPTPTPPEPAPTPTPSPTPADPSSPSSPSEPMPTPVSPAPDPVSPAPTDPPTPRPTPGVVVDGGSGATPDRPSPDSPSLPTPTPTSGSGTPPPATPSDPSEPATPLPTPPTTEPTMPIATKNFAFAHARLESDGEAVRVTKTSGFTNAVTHPTDPDPAHCAPLDDLPTVAKVKPSDSTKLPKNTLLFRLTLPENHQIDKKEAVVFASGADRASYSRYRMSAWAVNDRTIEVALEVRDPDLNGEAKDVFVTDVIVLRID